MTPKVRIIIDLQFGSTGKGLIAGYLAEQDSPDTIVTAWGPNAGHTYINALGNVFIHTMLANGIVSPGCKQILIGPGSVINIDNLLQEIEQAGLMMNGIKVLIHPHAAVVTNDHRTQEAGNMGKIGSTKKGTGAAYMQYMLRDPDNMNTAERLLKDTGMVCTIQEYNQALQDAELIHLEMAQGFSLSPYHGFYPYCTSRDVTPARGLSDAGIPLHWVYEIVGTLRTFPIRVNNAQGFSGPTYPDSHEIAWEELDIDAELTTVTKLPRRVFTFSRQQLAEAAMICGPTKLFLNFMNYLPPESHDEFIGMVEQIAWCKVAWTGHGPTANDVRERIPHYS